MITTAIITLALVFGADAPAAPDVPAKPAKAAKAKAAPGKAKKPAKPGAKTAQPPAAATPAAPEPEPTPAPAALGDAGKPAAGDAKPDSVKPAADLAAPGPGAPAAMPQPAPRASGALRVAILDTVKVGDIPARPLEAFAQALVPEIRKLDGVSAIGMSEVRDMLAFDKQRSLLGCSNEGCLAEIGGALGVDDIVTSQLALVGNSYSLSFKRLNMRRAKIVQAETKQFEKRDGEELLAMVGPMVEALFPERQLREGRTRGVDKEVVRRLNPPPLPRWVFYVTGGAAVVAAGAGGTFGLLSRDAHSTWTQQLQGSVGSNAVDGAGLKLYEQKATSNATRANIAFIGAGALVVAAGVEAFFTDWRNDRAALSVRPVAFLEGAGGGGGLALAGGF